MTPWQDVKPGTPAHGISSAPYHRQQPVTGGVATLQSLKHWLRSLHFTTIACPKPSGSAWLSSLGSAATASTASTLQQCARLLCMLCSGSGALAGQPGTVLVLHAIGIQFSTIDHCLQADYRSTLEDASSALILHNFRCLNEARVALALRDEASPQGLSHAPQFLE